MSKSIYSLVRLIRFLRDDQVKLSKKLLLIVPIVYFFSPIDLIFDFFPIPLIGYLDDLAVFVLMLPLIKSMLSNYSSGKNPDTRAGSNKRKYKEAIDIDKNDYKVR
ncbi:MAG: YkvA family protein [Halanaerobiales bacterium]